MRYPSVADVVKTAQRLLANIQRPTKEAVCEAVSRAMLLEADDSLEPEDTCDPRWTEIQRTARLAVADTLAPKKPQDTYRRFSSADFRIPSLK